MKPRVGTLVIERFRGFFRLEIEGFGRVNLVTGKNNTGKSSLLEAVRIWASDASPRALASILRFREEGMEDMGESGHGVDAEGRFQLSSLFHGYPTFSDTKDPIIIDSLAGQTPAKLVISAGSLEEKRNMDGSKDFVLHQAPSPDLLFAESMPALAIKARGETRFLPLDFWRNRMASSRLQPDFGSESWLPCYLVSPYGGEGTGALGPLWDKIALTNYEKDIVDVLRIVAPDIQAVSMVGSEGPRHPRRAIVRTSRVNGQIPLRSFGDGLNRLFGIVLSLVNAKDGILLIDEFENGMHHTVQYEAWKAIFQLAKRLNVQVFATSHSWDAIVSFQKAAAESPEEGVLVRLTCKDEEIVPTVFGEKDLAIVTRDMIEVR